MVCLEGCHQSLQLWGEGAFEQVVRQHCSAIHGMSQAHTARSPEAGTVAGPVWPV